MFPLRDTIPSRGFPIVCVLLIAANALVFLYELSLGKQLQQFIAAHALIPLKYAAPGTLDRVGVVGALWPFFSSMFLHGSWMHVISNMWMLWIFGDNVEDRLGHGRFVAFYLLSGLAAGLAQLWASWGSPIPTIGASGAIAGVMGAYMVLFPHARVLTLVPIFVMIRVIELPAWVFLGIWLWSQLQSGAMALRSTGLSGGVAWWAHIGGFLGGIVALGLLAGRSRGRVRYD